jgi:hypothetical protein
MTVDQAIAALGKPSYRLNCDEALCITEGPQQSSKGGEDCAAMIGRVHLLVLLNRLKVGVSIDADNNPRLDGVSEPRRTPDYQVDLDQTPCATGHLARYTSEDGVWPHTSLLYVLGPDTFRIVEFDADGRFTRQVALQYRGPLPEKKALNLAAFGLTVGDRMRGRTKVFSFPGCSAQLTLAWRPEAPGPQRPDDVYFYINSHALDMHQCADSWEVKRTEHYPGFDWPALPGERPPSEDFLVLESRSF